MRRLHLLELEDQAWCPKPIRDGATDFLEFTQNLGGPYDVIVEKLKRALASRNTNQVLDLCSGGAGPWPRLLKSLDAADTKVEVELTDLHPNAEAFARTEAAHPGRIRGRRTPVDATALPPGDARGFRTLFNGFHHFPPELGRRILADAVRQNAGIAVFEAVQRSVPQMIGIVFAALSAFFVTPFIRPFRWSRLLLTYVVPLIPFVILFDGLVSCLRVYSPEELRELVSGVDGQAAYDWDIGKVKSLGPSEITYLIGTPKA